MKIRIELANDPLPRQGELLAQTDCGAVVEFFGVVRGEENGAPIEALHYEAYERMAKSEMERLARELSVQFPCQSIEVMHRLGRVPVGDASILVRVEAKHRAEAFGLLAAFMDRLKQDVPIWKSLP